MKMNRKSWLRCVTALFILAMAAGSLLAQTPQPESIGKDLLRLEGTDAESGIHYIRLIQLLRAADLPADATPDSMPRFTMECREQAGKRSQHWLIRFEGSPDFAFQRPKVSTKTNPYPVPNPSIDLKMRFEGYMRSQEFKRQWEVLPTGELHYRNSGFHSANMDDPRNFLPWLISLPSLRIGYAKPTAGQSKELLFPLQPLLALASKTDLCQQ